MSNNLTDRAFPGTEDHDCGFTKHEYATLMLASSYISDPNVRLTEQGMQQVADRCYDLAKVILNKFS